MQIALNTVFLIHFIWDFVKKYIFRFFASRYLFLPFKPLRHNRMMSGFLGENTENFSDLIQIKKIPFSGGRPAELQGQFEISVDQRIKILDRRSETNGVNSAGTKAKLSIYLFSIGQLQLDTTNGALTPTKKAEHILVLQQGPSRHSSAIQIIALQSLPGINCLHRPLHHLSPSHLSDLRRTVVFRSEFLFQRIKKTTRIQQSPRTRIHHDSLDTLCPEAMVDTMPFPPLRNVRYIGNNGHVARHPAFHLHVVGFRFFVGGCKEQRAFRMGQRHRLCRLFHQRDGHRVGVGCNATQMEVHGQRKQRCQWCGAWFWVPCLHRLQAVHWFVVVEPSVTDQSRMCGHQQRVWMVVPQQLESKTTGVQRCLVFHSCVDPVRSMVDACT